VLRNANSGVFTFAGFARRPMRRIIGRETGAGQAPGSRELHAATECRTILADATFRDEEESLHDDRRQWQLPL
jgi:hypothetical protein